jgi:hypothetical protein
MDKIYIIRIYQQEDGVFDGIVEDVAKQTRRRFSNPGELWSLVTDGRQKNERCKVIKPIVFISKRVSQKT